MHRWCCWSGIARRREIAAAQCVAQGFPLTTLPTQQRAALVSVHTQERNWRSETSPVTTSTRVPLTIRPVTQRASPIGVTVVERASRPIDCDNRTHTREKHLRDKKMKSVAKALVGAHISSATRGRTHWVHPSVHSGKNPYKCEGCGKGFSQAIPVYIYQRIHTGERPHKCDVCGKGFSHNSP